MGALASAGIGAAPKNMAAASNVPAKTIPLILKSIVDDDSGSIAYNPAPDSYANNTTTGAVLLNCTNKETYETSGGKKAFVSVTFKINPDASGSADVYLNVKTLGFLISDKTSNTPQYLVKKSAAVAGSTNMYVTDDSYAAAYEGDFNEAYIPMVVDDTLKITTSLTLWMNLKVTYYVKKKLIGTMTDPYVTVKFGDVNEKIDGVLKTENGIEYYTFEYNGVCPQRMYDQYEVTVFASDNGILHYHTETKGVASYIYEGFDIESESSYYPVYVDLLNYGSAAQVQMNYIGASTFLEMYEAFMQDKRIYILFGLPDSLLLDEIRGFNPILLHGDLSRIPSESN